MIFTSLPSAGSPLGSSLFQLDAEVAAVDLGLDVEREPLDGSGSSGIRRRADDRPRDRDGLGHAAKRELAVDRDVVAVALDRLRGEAQLGEPLGVEEVGRLEVADELRLVEADARDLGAALELAVDQLRVELLEVAADRARAAVVDREADGRVNRIEAPGAGRNARVVCSAVVLIALPWFVVYT